MIGEQQAFLTVYLACCSRVLTDPVSVILMGSSASGKSYLQKSVVSLFPAETKIVRTYMTAKALAYAGENFFVNKSRYCLFYG